jgi:hypothetical protein
VYYVDGNITVADANLLVGNPSNLREAEQFGDKLGPVATGTLRLSVGGAAVWLKVKQTKETRLLGQACHKVC